MPQMKLIHPIWFVQSGIGIFLSSLVIGFFIILAVWCIGSDKAEYDTTAECIIKIIGSLTGIIMPIASIIFILETMPSEKTDLVYKYVAKEYPLLEHHGEYVEYEDGSVCVHYYDDNNKLVKEHIDTRFVTIIYDDQNCIQRVGLILENDIWRDEQEITEIHLGKEDKI